MSKKINDYMTGREDGLLMALDIVKKDGVAALEKEIQFRNVTGIRMPLAKKGSGQSNRKDQRAAVGHCDSSFGCDAA